MSASHDGFQDTTDVKEISWADEKAKELGLIATVTSQATTAPEVA